MGNSPSSVERHVEGARKTGVCSLREHKLTELPEEVLTLTPSLRTLDLSLNRLSILSPAIGDFTNLKSLNLSHNKLASLPESIGGLKKLETLTISHNLLSSLPSSLSSLTHLKSLTASHNTLLTFPSSLSQLTQLNFADLSANKISELPADGLGAMMKIVELNLNENCVTVLPETLAQCPRLKVLRVQENSLSLAGVPPSLLTSSSISLLCLEGNLFEMRELQEIPEYQQYMDRYTATKKKTD